MGRKAWDLRILDNHLKLQANQNPIITHLPRRDPNHRHRAHWKGRSKQGGPYKRDRVLRRGRPVRGPQPVRAKGPTDAGAEHAGGHTADAGAKQHIFQNSSMLVNNIQIQDIISFKSFFKKSFHKISCNTCKRSGGPFGI